MRLLARGLIRLRRAGNRFSVHDFANRSAVIVTMWLITYVLISIAMLSYQNFLAIKGSIHSVRISPDIVSNRQPWKDYTTNHPCKSASLLLRCLRVRVSQGF